MNNVLKKMMVLVLTFVVAMSGFGVSVNAATASVTDRGRVIVASRGVTANVVQSGVPASNSTANVTVKPTLLIDDIKKNGKVVGCHYDAIAVYYNWKYCTEASYYVVSGASNVTVSKYGTSGYKISPSYTAVNKMKQNKNYSAKAVVRVKLVGKVNGKKYTKTFNVTVVMKGDYKPGVVRF